MARTVWVDKEQCIGCELCVTNCPDVFRMDENNQAECYDPNGSSEDDIQTNAIDACPVSCIYWQD